MIKTMIAPPERLPERDAAILAMLPNVTFDGWTLRALRAGLTGAGGDNGDAAGEISHGAAKFVRLDMRKMGKVGTARAPTGMRRL